MDLALAGPDTTALEVVRFASGRPITKPYSRGELLGMAKRAALSLIGRGVSPGDCVVLSISDAASFFSFFVATQCIGAIPVPVPSISELPEQGYMDRLSSIVFDSRPRALVVDDASGPANMPSPLFGNVAVLEASSAVVADGAAGAPERFQPKRPPHEIAFLQYTSGSTGAPKGVVVRHSNLTANLSAIIEVAEVGSDDVVFSWLPLFHDMGLVVGLLLGLTVGIPTYVARPKAFALRPDAWLRAIHTFRATFSGGPNFAFSSLARRVPDRAVNDLDLSCWRLAFDGAEMVDPDTVRAFLGRYCPLGFRESSFRAAYGLAEATLVVAFPRPGMRTRIDCIDRWTLSTRGIAVPRRPDASGAVSYTSVGQAVPGHLVRILALNSSEELPERHLGEIVVSGPSVSPGYFTDLLAGHAPRSELRTGDVGYIADGELYVVDRLKDVLVIAGRKIVPTDVERVIGAIGGVRPGAIVAFSARGPHGTDELYIAAGLEARGMKIKAAIESAVRESLSRHFGLSAAGVFLLRPGHLPKTSSGKLRRSSCRSMLEAGQLANGTE